MSNEYRSHRKINAKDVAERLLPDLNMNELLLWSPDLFAYTSYIMSITGAYQLVVSPPTGKEWQPKNKEVMSLLGIKVNNKGEVTPLDENGHSITNRNQYINTILGINIKNWLLDFVRDSVDSEVEYKAILDNEEKKKWGGGQHFVETVVNSRVNDIIAELISSFSKIELDVDYIDTKIEKPEYTIHTEVGSGIETVSLGELFKYGDRHNWVQFVQGIGDDWSKELNKITNKEFYLINDAQLNKDGKPICNEAGKLVKWDKTAWKNNEEKEEFNDYSKSIDNKKREEKLFEILIDKTPPLLIASWAFFYNRANNIIKDVVVKEIKDVVVKETTKLEIVKKEDRERIPITDLLCNRDDIQNDLTPDDLWKISQSLLTIHAIADICCTKWGLETVKHEESERAQWFAERLLFDKGSLSTLNPERGRVMPKRHNPGVGITLRSLSSNLGFHRSSVEVVWRRTKHTHLQDQIEKQITKKEKATLSLLLLPFPLDVRAKDFTHDETAEGKVNFDTKHYGFFGYEPKATIDNKRIIDLIRRAGGELKDERFVDAIIFPEDALSKSEYESLEKALESAMTSDDKTNSDDKFVPPSLFIAGVRESRQDVFNRIEKEKQVKLLENEKELINAEIEELPEQIKNEVDEKIKPVLEKKLTTLQTNKDKNEFLINRIVNFSRNAVYCKYYGSIEKDAEKSYSSAKIAKNQFPPKYEQYKHHRWRLDSSQIKSYGLSQILDENKTWWEAIKIPKRRVSFINVGNQMTISHLVCEDLARQDPIADLIRHVGPSLVVTLLMDGPQVKHRWSGRYASVLSDDPGSSVIALTSWGMVKRHSSPYALMSKVIGLWSDGSQLREIELADGAEAVLLNLHLDKVNEKTADGRKERDATAVLRLLDVIQIYPEKTTY